MLLGASSGADTTRTNASGALVEVRDASGSVEWPGAMSDRTVILVHGYTPWNGNPTAMTSMAAAMPLLKRYKRGYLFNYATLAPISETSQVLWQAIHDTVPDYGHKQVDIVAHSMGGLVARHAIERRGMSWDVANLVMLGTPNLGTYSRQVAGWVLQRLAVGATEPVGGWGGGAVDLFDLLDEAAEDLVASPENTFLSDLNAPSGTDVNYYTLAGSLIPLELYSTDGCVSVDSAHGMRYTYSPPSLVEVLEDEARWTHGPDLPLHHLSIKNDALAIWHVRNFLLENTRPNLKIRSIAVSATSVGVGQPITVNVAVENVGLSSATRSFWIDVFHDAASRPSAGPGNHADQWQEVSSLARGAITAVTFNVSYSAPGTYKLWALPDGGQLIVESDEADNAGPAGGLAITVQATPVPPPVPPPGGNVDPSPTSPEDSVRPWIANLTTEPSPQTSEPTYARTGPVRIWVAVDDNQGKENVDWVRIGWLDPHRPGTISWGPQVAGWQAERTVDATPGAGMADGDYTNLRIQARDKNGNYLSEGDGIGRRGFVIDRTRPHASLLECNRHLVNGGDVTIRLDADDPMFGNGNVRRCRVGYKDPHQNGIHQWPWGWFEDWHGAVTFGTAGLWEGDYNTLVYEVWDKAGNDRVEEVPGRGFTLDRSPPQFVSGSFDQRHVQPGDPVRLSYAFADSNWSRGELVLKSLAHQTPVMPVGAINGTVDVETSDLPPGLYQLLAWGIDQVGNAPATPQSTGVFVTIAYFEAWLDAGLHFIGLPIQPADGSPEAILGSQGWQAFSFTSSTAQFVPVSTSRQSSDVPFAAGTGLWVWLEAAKTLRIPGDPVPWSDFDLSLSRGWNCVANPFETVLPWNPSAIQILHHGQFVGSLDQPAAQAYVLPYAWIFDSPRRRHQVVHDQTLPFARHEIPVMAGFWLKALADDVTVRLSPPSRQSRGLPVEASVREWSARLQATSGELQAGVMVGVTSQPGRAVEIAEPPSPVGPANLTMTIAGTGGDALVGAVRQWQPQEQSWDLTLSRAAPGDVTLSWPCLLRDLPRGVVLELEDLTNGQRLLLNTTAAHTVEVPAGGRRLRLTARTGNLQRSTITALSSAPGRGRGAQFTLTISGPAQVVLTVRGLGGQVVRTMSLEAEAGSSTIAWDGLDAIGRPVPRGTYQIEADARSANGARSRVTRTVLVR